MVSPSLATATNGLRGTDASGRGEADEGARPSIGSNDGLASLSGMSRDLCGATRYLSLASTRYWPTRDIARAAQF